MSEPICPTCRDCHLVCEDHGIHPWEGVHPGGCHAGPGMPCPTCNPLGLPPPLDGEVLWFVPPPGCEGERYE